MSKIKSGLILIAAGIGLNVAGRVPAFDAFRLMVEQPVFVGFFALLMVASVVIGLFGVFRLFVGLATRKKKEPSAVFPPQEGVWPPAPKPPDAS